MRNSLLANKIFNITQRLLAIGLGLWALLIMVEPLHAANIEAILDSADGSSVFAIQDSGAVEVSHIDSDGNSNFKGCLRIDSGGAFCFAANDDERLFAHFRRQRSDFTQSVCAKNNASGGYKFKVHNQKLS